MEDNVESCAAQTCLVLHPLPVLPAGHGDNTLLLPGLLHCVGWSRLGPTAL